MYDEEDRPLSKREGRKLADDISRQVDWGQENLKDLLLRHHEVGLRHKYATERGNIAVYICLALLIYIAFKV